MSDIYEGPHPKRVPMCRGCGSSKHVYSERYDAYACAACNVWMEPECQCAKFDQCEFKGRPSTPWVRVA